MDALRHQCLIYEGSPAKHLPSLAAVIVHRLKANNRCLYLNSPAMVAGMRSYLSAAGVNVEAEVRKGALVLSSDQSQTVNRKFDLDTMLAMLADAVTQALEDGYQALWASGDMTWEFGNERNVWKLIEYELRLEELFKVHTALHGVCQYHIDTLPLPVAHQALYTHRAVFINETLSRINDYYAPSSIPPNASAVELKKMLSHLLPEAGA